MPWFIDSIPCTEFLRVATGDFGGSEYYIPDEEQVAVIPIGVRDAIGRCESVMGKMRGRR